VKFLIDMPLSTGLAKWLVDHGHDAVHASEIGMDRTSDGDIMDRARQDGRIVVTADLDYPKLLVLAAAIEPSLILFRGSDWSEAEVRSRMDDLLKAVNAKDLERSIVSIDRKRFRRRRLPIV
jgi:predicted nuclease of predicted toxin-antitoxin system